MADKAPDQGALTRLAAWRPRRGVLSIYLRTDPADRREGWRVELRDGLKRIASHALDAGEDHRAAVEQTAQRVLSRFPDGSHPGGRCQLGFVEVSDGGGREMWRSLQVSPRRTMIVHRERPFLLPVLELLDDGSPVGVAMVSGEGVRLLEWSLGEVEEVGSWEPEFMKPLWRERRAPRVRDPARGHGISAAGKDQMDQRLEANREHFLDQVGREVGRLLGRRRWRALLAFGDKRQVDRLRHGIDHRDRLRLAEERNLLHAGRQEVAERVGRFVAEINRERERNLVESATSATFSAEGRGVTGLTETQRALEQGRVDHLLLAAERAIDARAPEHPDDVGEAGSLNLLDPAVSEKMAERALLTGARVTPVEGRAAELLAEYGGVAALLRY
jgi:hypothetical protein